MERYIDKEAKKRKTGAKSKREVQEEQCDNRLTGNRCIMELEEERKQKFTCYQVDGCAKNWMVYDILMQRQFDVLACLISPYILYAHDLFNGCQIHSVKHQLVNYTNNRMFSSSFVCSAKQFINLKFIFFFSFYAIIN